jgi:hypothetical protein
MKDLKYNDTKIRVGRFSNFQLMNSNISELI